MVFENYTIKEVSPEDSFLGELVEKTYAIESGHGFVLGDLYGIIKHVDDRNFDITRELDSLYLSLNSLLTQYDNLHKAIVEEWARRGKPKSLNQQAGEKRLADEKDNYRSEFCDR